MERLYLIISACLALCVEKHDAKPQFPSFPAIPNSHDKNIPPRFIANINEPTNHLKNKFSDSLSQVEPVLNENQLKLTNKEKLFILRRKISRNNEFGDLQPAFEDEESGFDGQQQVTLETEIQEHSGNLIDQVSGNNNLLSPQQRTMLQFPSFQRSSLKVVHHPEKLLNQLSLEQKHRFLTKFELLTQEQQIYAYNKFLSTPQAIQQFAINQFLSLDSQTLAVALQDEIRREEEISKLVEDHPGQTFSESRDQLQISTADQLALQQQQDDLQQIINLQNSINFPSIM